MAIDPNTGVDLSLLSTESTYKEGTFGAATPSALGYGIDSAAMAGGSGGSIWDDTTNFVSKGVPLIAKSIALSFMNMPADIGNWFGANNHIETMNEFLGDGQDEQQAYYAAHHQGIDAAGLIVGSFIPGLASTKLLSAAKVVKGIKAGAMLEDVSFATGLLPSVKNARVLAEATAEIKSNFTAYTAIASDTMKAAAWGIADQAFQAAAWETATIATMHSNPVLNSDGLGDSLDHIFWGGVTGGLFAAPFSILGARNALNSVKGEMEQLAIGQRTVAKPGIAKVIAGDDAATAISHVFEQEQVAPAMNAGQKATQDSRAAAVKLDAIQTMNKVSDDAHVSNAMVDMIYQMREKGMPLVGENGELGVMNYMMGAKGFHRVDNASFLTNNPDEFFLNIHSPATARGVDHLDGPNFMSNAFDPEAEHSLRVKFASEEAKNTFRYAVAGDPMSPLVQEAGSNVPQIVTGAHGNRLAPTAEKAWEWGYDAWINSQNRLHINPAAIRAEGNGGVFTRLGDDLQIDADSFKHLAKEGVLPDTYKKVVKTRDPISGAEITSTIDAPFQKLKSAAVTIDTKTGQVMSPDFNTPTIGDLASYKSNKLTGATAPDSPIKLINGGDTLEFGKRSKDYGIAKPYDVENATNLEANGRFVWAHLRGLKVGDSIAADDLPMLEAAVYGLQGKSAKEVAAMRLTIRENSGVLADFPESLDQLQQRVVNLKEDLLAKLAAPEAVQRSAADIATRLNVPVDWLDNPVAGDFAAMSINPAEHLQLRHVTTEFDLSPVSFDANSNVARGVQAMQYRIQQADERAKNAASAFFGENFERIVGTQGQDFNSGMADTTNTSSTMVKRADGGYSTLSSRLLAQGQALTEVIRKAKQAVEDLVTPAQHALIGDKVASAELAVLRNAHLRLSEKYAFLDTVSNPQMKKQVEDMLGRELAEGESLLVPRGSMGKDQLGNLTWDAKYKPAADKNPKDLANWITAETIAKSPDGLAGFDTAKAAGMYVVSPKVANFLKVQQTINDSRLIHHNNLVGTTGIGRPNELGNVYFPPMNPRNYQHLAFVRQTEGIGGGSSSTSMILGRNAEDLAERISLVKANHPELEVIPYGQTKEYFKARGDYDFNLNMTDNVVKSSMERKGVLVDYVPNINGETTLNDYSAWNTQQVTKLHRNYAELGNGQLYAELDLMGKQHEWLSKSRKGVSNEAQSGMSADNPYQALRYQGLGINPRIGYTLWNDAQDKVESLFTTAFNKARQAFGDVHKGLISVEQAEQITRKYGLGNPFGDTVSAIRNMQLSSGLPNSPMLEKFVRTANTIQTACAIRLDAMQGLINSISTPILMWPEALAAARKLNVTQLPDGSGANIGTLAKLTFQGMTSVQSRDPAMQAMVAEGFARGILKSDNKAYFDLTDALSLKGGETASQLSNMMAAGVDKAANLIGTNWSEQAGRAAAMFVGKQIFEAAGHTGQELWANINTFVNRVHGASIAAQRPILFQGPVGAAVGLFQTYQFNFLQNVFRYVGEGDYKALALLTGLQSSLYGMQGLPGYSYINQNIIGNARNNPAHSDIYSGTKSLLGDHLGDLVMYGGVSNILQTGLYTRGDINPRSVTVIPVNPMDIPTVSSAIRVLSNIHSSAQKLQDGGAFWNTFTEGLEHNALSRPLSGLGQLLQGYSTTAKGSLISANRPADIRGPGDLLSIANAARLTGARPLDESVIMDAMYRHTAYQAADTDRMASLGEAVKETVRKGQAPTESQMATFVSKYAAAGGYPTNFGKNMVDWVKSANTSVANETFKKLQTPAVQNQQRVMGGQKLPDYTMAPIGAPAQVTPADIAATGTQAAPTEGFKP